nr:autotransporter domain-containing protein [Candidatus Rhodobacter lobularis]
MADGQLAPGATCTVEANVTATATATNGPATLNTSNGSSASASVGLTVDAAATAVGKAFAPTTIGIGGVSRLTLTVDNSAGANAQNFTLTDNLPAGMVLADPPNTATTCPVAQSQTLTGVGGGSILELQSTGGLVFTPSFMVVNALPAGTVCTVSADVTASVPGSLQNVTEPFLDSGSAAATLTVTGAPAGAPQLTKEFTDDPVAAGGSATLEFEILNRSRSDAASNIAFTDDMSALFGALAGTVTAIGTNTCGGTPSGVGTSSLSYSGGTVGAGLRCNITVTISVPAGVSTGSYTNTSTAVTADVGGMSLTGNAATANLSVLAALDLPPVLSFTTPDGNAGGVSTWSFTLSNAASSALTDGTFDVQMNPPLPFPTNASLPPMPDPPCGVGSSLSLAFLDTDQQALRLTGASLATSGAAGDSCTFDVDIGLNSDLPPLQYNFTSGAPSGTVNGATRTGTPASSSMTVGTNLNLSFAKSFLATAVPGGTVDLEFVITSSGDSTDATAISFTDDINAMLAGTSLNAVISNECGGNLTGTTNLSYTGGSLTGGTSCAIVTRLDVPAAAAIGTYTNTTSALSATPSGSSTVETFGTASADLTVAGLTFEKEFLTNTVLAGDTTTLRFTISNVHPTADATITSFTDNLQQNLTGLAATGGPSGNTCGGTLSGTTFLIYTGGSVTSGMSCTIDVEVLVPVGTADGSYGNTTSTLSATQGGGPVVVDPATDILNVQGLQIELSKAFTDDPVAPGDNATLEFTLSNLSSTEAISNIAFTDDLAAMLPGTTFASVAGNDCGATVGGTGTSTISVSGTSLAASATCTITVAVTVPGGAVDNTYTNTTSSVTGDIGGLAVTGDPATAQLSVSSILPLAFSKSFSGSVASGESGTLTFTLSNPNTTALSDLGFTDDLNAMLTGVVATSLPSAPCGLGSSITGTSSLTASGFSLDASGGSCTFDVGFSVPVTATGATYLNTTSELVSFGLSLAPPATANLIVTDPVADLSLAIADSPDPVTPGQNLVYTVTASNAGPQTAQSVAVNLPVPTGTTLVSTTGCAEDPSGAATCSLGNIASGGNAQYTLTVTVDAATSGTVSASGTVSSSTSDPVAGNNTATASTSAPATADISITKSDGVTSANSGGTTTYSIVVANAGPSADPAVSVADTFAADLGCATTSVAAGGATGNTAAFSGDIAETLSMPASSSVTYTATCDIAITATGTLSNTATATASVLDPNATNNSATDSDTALVAPVAMGFSKAFSPATIDQGANTTLTFTIDNTANAVAADNLNFTDGFPLGVDLSVAAPVVSSSTCGGTFNPVAGGGNLVFSGGSVAAGATCTVSVLLNARGSGTATNTSSQLGSFFPTPSAAATADITVNPAVAPTFAKAFGAATIEQGQTTTATFTINNSANSIEASSLQFSDTLPVELVVAATPNASTTCTGGTITATAGSGSILYSGGEVAAGATCTVTVTVDSLGSGSIANPSLNLTSSLPTATAAATPLTINPATAPGVAKTFTPSAITQGETSALSITIDNSANFLEMTGVAFTDAFPSGMVVGPTPGASNTCGGTFSASAGSGTISLSGGTVAAGATCSVGVTVRGNAAGTLTNPAFDVTSNIATGTAAATDLAVNPAAAPGFAKAFGAGTINQGGTVVATVSVDNSGNAADLSGMGFTDTLPAGLVIAATPAETNTCGGSLTANAGASTFALSGGALAGGGTCAVSVTLRALEAGSLTNPMFDLTSNIATATAASAILTVNAASAPVVAKGFAPAIINQGQTTTATVSIDNAANLIEATGVAFTDALPSGLVVAPTPAGSNTCGGTLTANAGASSFALSGGTIAEGASCQVTVALRALDGGTLTNPAFDVTSSIATGTVAATDLTVNAAAAPGFAKAFSVSTLDQGQSLTATVTIDNAPNAIEASNLAFTDALPAGLVIGTASGGGSLISTTCGGTASATTGASSFSLSGGTLAEGASCTVVVVLRAVGAGTLTNPAMDLTSSIATATSAPVSLTANAAAAPVVTKVFAPATIEQGQTTTATITIDNAGNSIEAASLAFTDTLPAGLQVAAVPNESNTCGGTLTAAAGTGAVSLSGGTLAEGASCAIAVDLRATLPGTLTNPGFDVTSSIATGSAAATDLTVNAAAAMGFAKAFAPATIDLGSSSTLTFTIDNSANAIEAASMAFTDSFPAGLIVSSAPAATNTCGGTFTATALSGLVSLSGGTLAAGTTCTLSVQVQALTTGSLDNTSSELTSDLPSASPVATASLTVNAVPITSAASFNPPIIELFELTELVFLFQNDADIDQILNFIQNLPAGLNVGGAATSRANAMAGTNVSTTCSGGTVTAVEGSTQVQISGATVPANGSCELKVNVIANAIGDFSNLVGDADLVVNTIARAFVTYVVTGSDGSYAFSSSATELNATVAVAGGTGTQGPLRSSEGSYSVAIAPPTGVAFDSGVCDDGDSSVDLANNAIALTLSPLESVTCTFTALSPVQQTVDVINQFLTKRADLILSTEPNLGARGRDRLGRGFGNASALSFANGDLKAMLPFTATMQPGNYSFKSSLLQVRQAAASVQLAHGSTKDAIYVPNYRFDAWFEAHHKEFDTGTNGTGHFTAAHIGADYVLNENLLIGAMVSFDSMEDDTAISSASGSGWLIGPYMTAKLAPNLYFDARLAGGASNNKVSPFNTYTDSFDTRRLLASASLSGDFQQGNWTISPTASLSYYRETQDSYIDSTGASIPSQTVELGQLKIGPTFTGRFLGDDGEIIAPYFSVDAIYNLGQTSGVTVTNPDTASTSGWRGRLKAGVTVTEENGTKLGIGATYDGLFRSDFDAWGLSFELEIPLQKPTAR